MWKQAVLINLLFTTLATGVDLRAASDGDKLAITGGTIIPVTGERIERGTVLISNGRISAVGADLEVPEDAEVIDASGKFVFPGLVLAHTQEGLDQPNENVSVTPFVSVLDAINAVDNFFEESLRAGTTSILIIPGNNTVIGGQGRVVKPFGLTVEEMTVKAVGGMKMSASPKRGANAMAHMAELRKAFAEFRDYLEVAADKKMREKPPVESGAAGKALDPLTLLKKRDLESKRRALFDVVRGRMPVFFYCDRAMDVAHAIEIARENGFLEHTTLVVGAQCWKAADEIAAAGVSVVLPVDFIHTETNPLSGEVRKTSLAKVFQDKGIPFALTSASRSAMIVQRSLLLRAAEAVASGVPRAAALRAVTIDAARILGLDQRLGSIEKGKDANLLLLSGEPLADRTWVEEVILEGKRVYSRAKDERLRRLTGDAKDGGR